MEGQACLEMGRFAQQWRHLTCSRGCEAPFFLPPGEAWASVPWRPQTDPSAFSGAARSQRASFLGGRILGSSDVGSKGPAPCPPQTVPRMWGGGWPPDSLTHLRLPPLPVLVSQGSLHVGSAAGHPAWDASGRLTLPRICAPGSLQPPRTTSRPQDKLFLLREFAPLTLGTWNLPELSFRKVPRERQGLASPAPRGEEMRQNSAGPVTLVTF